MTTEAGIRVRHSPAVPAVGAVIIETAAAGHGVRTDKCVKTAVDGMSVVRINVTSWSVAVGTTEKDV